MATYKSSGVSIDNGNEFVSRIKDKVRSTHTKGVVNSIGGFASLFRVDWEKYKKPLLVSSTDGVGSKLKIAFMANKHDTIGIDLVAMSVNDILVYGAQPLFFLDYLAVSNLDVDVASSIMDGIVKGCKDSNCALVGGETAEMPAFYHKGEYDCAGFVVGVVDGEKLIDGKNVNNGDVIIGVESSGIHSNGYSLVRKIFFEMNSFKLDHVFPELGRTLGEALLTPTHIYVKPILEMLDNGFNIKSMCHVTGGGITENLPRVIADGFGAEINLNNINVKPIFKLMARLGEVDTQEMLRVFNMGVGYIIVVPENEGKKAIDFLAKKSLNASVIGTIARDRMNQVVYTDIDKFKL
ncbi:MAG: phosphoribosylformylglycinamidine cyclo-ligase [Pseudomonadota bacterium]